MRDAVDTYRGYRIEVKRDFGTHGFYVNGRTVKHGYVVTDGVCNVLPGATWAHTIYQARGLIDALIESGGDSKRFWEIVRQQKEAA